MKRNKSLVAVFTMLIMSLSSQAQDIHFSQFYENAILRNPALTGIFSGDYKVGVNYRNQWSSISVPFQTLLAAAESRVLVNEAGDNFSFGVTASYDKAGTISFNSFQIYPAVNYNKALEDHHQSYLSAGFTAGYIERSVDVSKMSFASQYQGGNFDPGNASNEQFNKTKSSYFDVGAGVSFNSSLGEFNQVNYYFGAAAYHINKPRAAFNKDESFLRLNTKWNGNFGFQYLSTKHLGLTFHANYTRQGPYQEIIAGMLGSWRIFDLQQRAEFGFYAGLFYRVNDALIPTVKLDYKNYSFTMSYDLTTSGLKAATNGMGGMEISVYSRGVLSQGPWAQDKNKCPRFESLLIPEF